MSKSANTKQTWITQNSSNKIHQLLLVGPHRTFASSSCHEKVFHPQFLFTLLYIRIFDKIIKQCSWFAV